MHLKILLPSEIFADKNDVLRVIAETRAGSFGILPHRLDCLAALAPGILTYETQVDGVVDVAVDEGVMVKAGMNVIVSVRRAVAGTDLGKLHDAVKQEFLRLDESDRTLRDTLAKMEGGLVGRFAEFQRDR